MRVLIIALILTSSLAAQNSGKTPPPPPAKPAKKAPALNAIPKDAVETEPGFFRWTDKDGKAWTYRRTPFGVSRWPAETLNIRQDAMDKQNAVKSRTTAVAEGDSIRFEEGTPFGKRTWVRKKTELTETERRIWDAQQKDSTASRTAEKE
jgi:hypothetical protein